MKIDAHLPYGAGVMSESKGRESSLVNGIKEGDSQIIANVNNLLQFVGRHGTRVRERETFLIKQPSAVSSLTRESRVSSARVGRVNMFHPPRSGKIDLQGARVEYVILLRRRGLSPARVFCIQCCAPA